MENHKNTHYLACLYIKLPCHYVFIFVKHFSWEISALCPKLLQKTAVTRDHGILYHIQTHQDAQLIEQTQRSQQQVEFKKQIIPNWPQLPSLHKCYYGMSTKLLSCKMDTNFTNEFDYNCEYLT